MGHEGKRKGMQSVRPLRTQEEVERFLSVARKHDMLYGVSSFSWELLVLVGINTGLRISDMVRLKVKDIRAPKGWKIYLTAKKTGKELGNGEGQIIPNRIHDDIIRLTDGRDPDEWLFQSRQVDKYTEERKPISRNRAWQIINEIADEADIEGHIGCHTLRKTFGYNYYQRYKELAYLQKIFCHSTEAVTSRYIGLDQAIIDERLRNL